MDVSKYFVVLLTLFCFGETTSIWGNTTSGENLELDSCIEFLDSSLLYVHFPLFM